MVSVGNSVNARLTVAPGRGPVVRVRDEAGVVTDPTATFFGTLIKVKRLTALVWGSSLPRRACAEARPPEFRAPERRMDLLSEESTR